MPNPQSTDADKPNSPFKPLNLVVALVLIAGALWFLRPDFNSAPAPTDVLFKLGGVEYRSADLPLKYSQPLYQAELAAYQRQQQILGAAAVHFYVEQQMEKTGESRDSVINRLFTPTAPSEQQIQQFYSQNQARIGAPLEQSRKEISTLLMARQQQQKQLQLLAKLGDLNELQFNISKPEAPFSDLDTRGYPSQGVADAAVTLVEFADYQCPHCKTAYLALKTQLQPFLDRIRYVYMDFPINRSGISRKISEGGVCADAQGQFWDYHDLAYQQQEQLHEQSPRQFAEQLGLDVVAFDRCLQSDETVAKVRRSEQQAIAAGVTGTPSFFINGRKLTPQELRSGLATLIDEALQLSQ